MEEGSVTALIDIAPLVCSPGKSGQFTLFMRFLQIREQNALVQASPVAAWGRCIPISEAMLGEMNPHNYGVSGYKDSKRKRPLLPSERGHRTVRASKGPHPLGTGAGKQNTRTEVSESPLRRWYSPTNSCRSTFGNPSPEGLFTYHRSSGPVFWCIHGLRHTKYHMLGAERRGN